MAAKTQSEMTEKEKSFERKPLPYLFEKELIERQAKHFWIVDEFRPYAIGRKIHPIERKFYARHEQKLPPGYKNNFECYTKLDSRHTKEFGLPRLESQVYGWLPNTTRYEDKYLKELNFISAPKLRCDLTIYGESVISERITERPAFYGLRFFLR